MHQRIRRLGLEEVEQRKNICSTTSKSNLLNKLPSVLRSERKFSEKVFFSSSNYQFLFKTNQNDNFTVIANTLEKAIKLMKVGYEFHIEIEENKLLR